MPGARLTTPIYAAAAVAASCYWLSLGVPEGTLPGLLLQWLISFAAPLLFVYAYPRFLFSRPLLSHRLRHVALLHALSAIIACTLFLSYGAAFWRNPLRDVSSLFLFPILLIAVPVFLVAAGSLLLRNKSTLAMVACLLFWPYWLFLALLNVGRFFDEPLFPYALSSFFCFLVPVLFAFAAGALRFRPALAHVFALTAFVGVPWIYWKTLKDTPLGNIWTMFNLPDRDLGIYDNLHLAEFTILSIALVVLAIATAAFRLLPDRLSFRGAQIRERTGPALAITLIFVAVWFARSVMPYRIAGAADYADWPILQILHVEKHGLQFHETCVRVRGYRGDPFSISVSWNDRRLFHYRFQENYADLPEISVGLARPVIRSLKEQDSPREAVKPLRAWNAEGWYVMGEKVGLETYTSENGTAPPREIVDLFTQLASLPRAPQTYSDLKDVCLGFCYDPLSGLGLLYANHRCVYDAARRDYVCR